MRFNCFVKTSVWSEFSALSKKRIMFTIFSVFCVREGFCVESPFINDKVRFKINWTGDYVICVVVPKEKEEFHPADHIADMNISHHGKMKKLNFSKPYLVVGLREKDIEVCESYRLDSKGYYDFSIIRFGNIQGRSISLDLLPVTFVK